MSGQVEVSNYEIRKILQKMVNDQHNYWLVKLDDALWTYKTTNKMPIGSFSYHFLYGKAFYLPMKLEHQAYWVVKKLNPRDFWKEKDISIF